MPLPVMENDIDVMDHVGLVCQIAAQHGARIPYEETDHFQSGFLGLMIAKRHFDPSRGFTFATYATHWIRSYIRRGTVGVYRSVYYRPVLTFTDLARSVNLSRGCDFDEIDPTVSAEPDPREAAQSEEVGDRVRSIIRVLDKRSASIVERHVMNGETLEECGKSYGVTRSRAQQIVQKALRTLEKHPNTYRVLNGVQYG